MRITPFSMLPTNHTLGSQRHPRKLLSFPIKLKHLVPGGVRFTDGISLDLSESGLGALVQGGLTVGETVSVECELPDDPLKVAAIVRHSSSLRSGFEFLGLTPDERQHISRLVASA